MHFKQNFFYNYIFLLTLSLNDPEHCFQKRIIDVLASAIIVGGLAYLVSNGMLLYNWVTSADPVQMFDRM